MSETTITNLFRTIRIRGICVKPFKFTNKSSQNRLPLYNLRILRTDYEIAYGWQADNVDCLLAKAKVAKVQAQREAECMANVGGHLRCVQIGTEERRKEQCEDLTNQEVQL